KSLTSRELLDQGELREEVLELRKVAFPMFSKLSPVMQPVPPARADGGPKVVPLQVSMSHRIPFLREGKLMMRESNVGQKARDQHASAIQKSQEAQEKRMSSEAPLELHCIVCTAEIPLLRIHRNATTCRRSCEVELNRRRVSEARGKMLGKSCPTCL